MIDLEAVKRRAKAATPGEWFQNPGHPTVWTKAGGLSRSNAIAHTSCDGERPHPNDLANADFIAHAREDVPALVARVEALENVLVEISGLAAWHFDPDADPENESPEDQTAHVNGLIISAIEKANG